MKVWISRLTHICLIFWLAFPLQSAHSDDEKKVRGAEIGAAALVTGGLVMGASKYAARKSEAKASKRNAEQVELQTLLAKRAIIAAIQPELQRFGEILLTLSGARKPTSQGPVTPVEARVTIMNGLESPEARGRILRSLKKDLGENAGATFQMLVEANSQQIVERELTTLLELSNKGLMAIAKAKIGQSLAESLAKATAPTAGRLVLSSLATKPTQGSCFRRIQGYLGL